MKVKEAAMMAIYYVLYYIFGRKYRYDKNPIHVDEPILGNMQDTGDSEEDGEYTLYTFYRVVKISGN